MKRVVVCVFAVLFCTALFAQSSGNFAAKVATTQCLINDGTGLLEGGLEPTLLETTVKTPNASSTALVIRPSLVTGLYTRTKVTDDTAAKAIAGVQVRVLLDGAVVAPGTDNDADPAADDDDGWVYYDKRFQQLQTNIFNLIGDDCNPDLAVFDQCYIDLIQSTLSAHSMDFVAGDVGGATHAVKVEWKLSPTTATAQEAACVGPGVLTVQQVKTFTQSGGIEIQ